jgi:hypothetical protein
MSLDSRGQCFALAILLDPGRVETTERFFMSQILRDPSADPVSNFDLVFSNATADASYVC